jgi:L-threonylcarbamoyladenylate synthase
MQKEVKKALEVLRKGGVILYPTDTIWGIGCDATNQEAVDKVYTIKKRDPQKSMLVLVRDFFMAERYLEELPDIGIQLFEATDSPLTLILDGARNVAKNLPANDGSIGMRIPEDSFCQELLNQFRKPIVSTSANFSGKKSPDSFLEIEDEMKEVVDYVVNWKQDGSRSKASSVIQVRKNGEIKILRK